jgi:hypothetical protein
MDWSVNAHTEVELIISLDEDDPLLNDYKLPCKIINKNKSAVDAINRAAEVATGDILIVVSDDTECFYGWGKQIEKIMHGKCDWILKTQDGIQPWLITMPLMDRTYYERFGYIYHPSYKHMYADTDLTCVADLTGCKIVSTFNFPHKHYSITGEGNDAVSRRADATFESGRLIFKDRLSKMFDMKPEDIKGELTQNIYTQGRL